MWGRRAAPVSKDLPQDTGNLMRAGNGARECSPDREKKERTRTQIYGFLGIGGLAEKG